VRGYQSTSGTEKERRRPLVDIAKFESIVSSETKDSNDRHIQLATPFELARDYAEQLQAKKRLEEAKRSDEELLLALEGRDALVTFPSLSTLCLRQLSRRPDLHSVPEIDFFSPDTLTRLSLYACRYKTMTQPLLECMCSVRPAMSELYVGQNIKNLERGLVKLPTLPFGVRGTYFEDWERIVDDSMEFLPSLSPLMAQPLCNTLITLHLLGCNMTGHALTRIGIICTSICNLTLHRLHVTTSSGGSRWLSELLLLPEGWGAEDGGTGTEFGPSTKIAPCQEARPWPSLESLDISHCLSSHTTEQCLRELLDDLYIPRNRRKNLSRLWISPAPVNRDCEPELTTQFAALSVSLEIGTVRINTE